MFPLLNYGVLKLHYSPTVQVMQLLSLLYLRQPFLDPLNGHFQTLKFLLDVEALWSVTLEHVTLVYQDIIITELHLIVKSVIPYVLLALDQPTQIVYPVLLNQP